MTLKEYSKEVVIYQVVQKLLSHKIIINNVYVYLKSKVVKQTQGIEGGGTVQREMEGAPMTRVFKLK